jgi:hypothetical protein
LAHAVGFLKGQDRPFHPAAEDAVGGPCVKTKAAHHFLHMQDVAADQPLLSSRRGPNHA